MLVGSIELHESIMVAEKDGTNKTSAIVGLYLNVTWKESIT
jgi:hypothetical protein